LFLFFSFVVVRLREFFVWNFFNSDRWSGSRLNRSRGGWRRGSKVSVQVDRVLCKFTDLLDWTVLDKMSLLFAPVTGTIFFLSLTLLKSMGAKVGWVGGLGLGAGLGAGGGGGGRC